ncbi:MAG TPA: protease complex subunit PrcB family protein [Flavobacterium sp.]|jgi:hypothetical protein|nr:protease complex subunit PrcB family protein [Flavobacterium sp.]
MNKSFLKIARFGLIFLIIILSLNSCKSTKNSNKTNLLYEVLTEQNDGGANFRFYEILTEEKEIKMLLSDSKLKGKIEQSDINTCNFVILNMGEQTNKNAIIKVKKVEETTDKILIFVEDGKSKETSITDSEINYPYTIVKIYSKKEIVIQ